MPARKSRDNRKSASYSAVMLDRDLLDALLAQAEATVRQATAAPRVLEKLVARAGLVLLWESYAERNPEAGDCDPDGGLAAELWRCELLGIMDLVIGDWTVGVAVLPVGARAARFNRAQVEAGTAPDMWAMLHLERRRGGLQARLLGWQCRSALIAQPADMQGVREVQLVDLQGPATFFEHVSAGLPDRRRDLAEMSRVDIRVMLASPKPLAPLSRMQPAVFDCLVEDYEMALAYMTALEQQEPTFAHAAAPDAWALPTSTLAQVRQLVANNDLEGALDMLRSAGDQLSLALRSMVQRLRGNNGAAIADARQAFRAAPEKAPGLLQPVKQTGFALAWQYAPQAQAAAAALEVVDATAPESAPGYEAGKPRIRVNDGQATFALGVQMSPDYADYHYRVFVIDEELRQDLQLEDDARLRQAFGRTPDLEASENDYVLLVNTAVLTASGALLEGKVDERGLIDVFEPVETLGRPAASFLSDKTVVVVLYRNGDDPR